MRRSFDFSLGGGPCWPPTPQVWGLRHTAKRAVCGLYDQ